MAASSPTPGTPRRRRAQGFTLVELLVVIGIIFVLAALLMPAISSARQKASTAICASNERQFYQASILFMQDNGGRLPVPTWVQETAQSTSAAFQRTACWVNVDNGVAGGLIDFEVGGLWQYVGTRGDVSARKSILNCPGDRDERSLWGVPAVRNFSYSFNSNIRKPGGTVGSGTAIRLAAVLQPADKIMVYEELGPNDAWCTTPHRSIDDIPAGRHGSLNSQNASRDISNAATRWPAYYNQGLGNHCFFDGHVELLSPRWIAEGKGRNQNYRSWTPLVSESWPETQPTAPQAGT
jgi:type II secretory pathway pseudopilin PulG